MPAATPRLYFQTLCQHEVFRVIATMNAGAHFARVMLLWQHDQCFFIFRKKGIK